MVVVLNSFHKFRSISLDLIHSFIIFQKQNNISYILQELLMTTITTPITANGGLTTIDMWSITVTFLFYCILVSPEITPASVFGISDLTPSISHLHHCSDEMSLNMTSKHNQ